MEAMDATTMMSNIQPEIRFSKNVFRYSRCIQPALRKPRSSAFTMTQANRPNRKLNPQMVDCRVFT